MFWLQKKSDSQGVRTANQTRRAVESDTEAQAGLMSSCPDICLRGLSDLGGRMDLCLFFSHSVSANLSPPLTAYLSHNPDLFLHFSLFVHSLPPS